MNIWRIGAMLVGLGAMSGPARGQDGEAAMWAQLWDSCLMEGPGRSIEAFCTEALAIPGLSAADWAALLAQRGSARAARGAWEQAMPDIEHALYLHPDEPTARLVQGLRLVDQRMWDRGIADLTAYLGWAPGHAGALNSRAVANARTGRTAAAVADFTLALQAVPNHPVLLHNRANAMRDAGQVDQAVREYDRLWLLAGKSARLLSDRCLARLVRGDIRLAFDDCAAAVAMAPDDAGLIENRGMVALKWKPEKALADFNLALAIRQDLPWSFYGRGIIRLRRGDAARGAADIRAAQALDPKVGEQFARFGIKP